MPSDRAVTIAGIATRILEASPPGAPADAAEAVLFVHGNPGSRLDWADLVDRVGAFARAVALDLPGFAQAGRPDRRAFPYTVPAYAAWLESARQVLGLRRVHLVVHDFGGPFGLEWAGAHLDDVGSVTVVNAPPVQGYRWYLLAKAWRTPVLGELVQLGLVGPTFRLIAGRGHPKGLPPGFLDRMYADYDRDMKRAVLALYRATDARRMVSVDAARFAAADIPALVVWAANDVYMDTRFAYVHRAAFPSADVVELPDRGHFVLAEDPEAVAAHVVPFLRRQVGAAAPSAAGRTATGG